jgi:hypothetical protein
MLRAALLAAAFGLAVGCAGPLWSGDMSGAQRCEHSGGWWRPDQLFGGHCEYQGTGFP